MSVGGAVKQLEGFLLPHSEHAEEYQSDGQSGDEQDGIHRRSSTRIEAREPLRKKVVPSGGHRKAGKAGKQEAGRRGRTHQQQEYRPGGEVRSGAGVAKSGSQGLRNGTDQIDGAIAYKRDYGAGAKDEHQGDNRRGDRDGFPDIAPGIVTFTGHDRHIFESAERSHGHLAEDGKADPRSSGPSDRDRRIS